MDDKEAVKLWAAIDQIIYALGCLDDAIGCLANREKSLSRMARVRFARRKGAIEALADNFCRDRKLEEGST